MARDSLKFIATTSVFLALCDSHHSFNRYVSQAKKEAMSDVKSCTLLLLSYEATSAPEARLVMH